jgi:hypothetical protein
MAALSGLIGKFLGVESSPITFERSGVKWAVKASSFVDMAAQAAMGINPGATELSIWENTGHPARGPFRAGTRREKPTSTRSGLSWDDISGNEQRAVRGRSPRQCA